MLKRLVSLFLTAAMVLGTCRVTAVHGSALLFDTDFNSQTADDPPDNWTLSRTELGENAAWFNSSKGSEPVLCLLRGFLGGNHGLLRLFRGSNRRGLSR